MRRDAKVTAATVSDEQLLAMYECVDINGSGEVISRPPPSRLHPLIALSDRTVQHA